MSHGTVQYTSELFFSEFIVSSESPHKDRETHVCVIKPVICLVSTTLWGKKIWLFSC